jgi:hypothetical protein
MDVTSEMFLSIMILLQNSLPCTENFYRYQKNFEKYISTEDGGEAGAARPGSGGQVNTIASPRMMSNSPLASLAKQHGINFNPNSQKNMLQFAGKRGEAGTTTEPVANEGAGNNGEVNVANFMTAKGV